MTNDIVTNVNEWLKKYLRKVEEISDIIDV